jgi:hypothetical protein
VNAYRDCDTIVVLWRFRFNAPTRLLIGTRFGKEVLAALERSQTIQTIGRSRVEGKTIIFLWRFEDEQFPDNTDLSDEWRKEDGADDINTMANAIADYACRHSYTVPSITQIYKLEKNGFLRYGDDVTRSRKKSAIARVEAVKLVNETRENLAKNTTSGVHKPSLEDPLGTVWTSPGSTPDGSAGAELEGGEVQLTPSERGFPSPLPDGELVVDAELGEVAPPVAVPSNARVPDPEDPWWKNLKRKLAREAIEDARKYGRTRPGEVDPDTRTPLQREVSWYRMTLDNCGFPDEPDWQMVEEIEKARRRRK